ncbi:MAG: alpha/beta hydrolase, partial [Ilumatobacteraceae bacterium]
EVATQTIETEVEDTIVRGRKVFDPQAGARHIDETYTAPAATFAGLYGSEAHQIFKVFTPAGWTASDRRDLVVFVHGGAWSFGSADEVESVSMDLLAQGAVIVSIEYELEVPAFDQIADVVAAVRWAQANADGLGADIDRTFLVGHSAGAHLSLLTAVAPNEVRGGDFLRPVIGVIGVAGPDGINDANYDPERDRRTSSSRDRGPREPLRGRRMFGRDPGFAGTVDLCRCQRPGGVHDRW